MDDPKIARPAGLLALTTAASLGAHVLSLAIPLALLQTYDRILPNQAFGTTLVLAVGVGVAIVLEAILRYGRAVLFAHAGAIYERRMSVALLDRVMHAEGPSVQRLGAPALAEALRSIGQVRDFWSGSVGAALHESPFVAIYFLLIAYVGGWLVVIPLSITSIALLASAVLANSTARAVHDADAAEADRRDLVWGIFAGLVHAKSMAAGTKLSRNFEAALSPAKAAAQRLEILMGLVRENGALLSQVSTIATVTFGAFMVVSGHLSTGGLAACTMLAGRSIGPTMAAFSYFARRRQCREAEARVDEVLSLPLAPVFEGDSGKAYVGGAIGLSGPALESGSVSIPAGSIVKVDTPDAQAASALLQAISRRAEAPGLDVTYGGYPGATFDSRSLHRNMATVVARPRLLSGTILENLTLFAPQYDADAVALSDRIGLRDFVDGLRNGFMTQVGDVGSEILGGGLAARIGIVRALVRRPMVLCLDQADATLDLDGVKRLASLLGELKGRVTVFVVSSNPAILGLADLTVTLRRSERQ